MNREYPRNVWLTFTIFVRKFELSLTFHLQSYDVSLISYPDLTLSLEMTVGDLGTRLSLHLPVTYLQFAYTSSRNDCSGRKVVF